MMISRKKLGSLASVVRHLHNRTRPPIVFGQIGQP
jgi:hypothetical protein